MFFFLQGRECFLFRVEESAFIKVHICFLKSCGAGGAGTATPQGAKPGARGAAIAHAGTATSPDLQCCKKKCGNPPEQPRAEAADEIELSVQRQLSVRRSSSVFRRCLPADPQSLPGGTSILGTLLCRGGAGPCMGAPLSSRFHPPFPASC